MVFRARCGSSGPIGSMSKCLELFLLVNQGLPGEVNLF